VDAGDRRVLPAHGHRARAQEPARDPGTPDRGRLRLRAPG
jgi:hypothetical protein